MCGGGVPFAPYGFGMAQYPAGWDQMRGPVGMTPYERQMFGMMGGFQQDPQAMRGTGMAAAQHWAEKDQEEPRPVKSPHCAHCGRPVKMNSEDSCKGCGSWEVELK